MNVAEFVCHYLNEYKVNNIYGYPGAAILPLMDAIDKHPNLEWILMRQEAGAAFAAGARAKLTNKLSVCMATSGPGATNMITGVLDANLDRAPVLIITGLLPGIKRGLSYFQDINQVDILASVCQFSAICEHPLQVSRMLQSAVGYAIKHSGTVHLAIPMDIQAMELDDAQYQSAAQCFSRLHYSPALMAPPAQAFDIVAQTIAETEDLIIAVGPRARGVGSHIEKLAQKLQAPMICSFAGKGVINENHENYFGVLGLFGAPANELALSAIKEAKAVLAFGIDDLVHFLTDKDINQQRDFIQCEPDIASLSYQFSQKRVLLGRLDTIADELSIRSGPRSGKLLETAKLKRQQFIEKDKNSAFTNAKNTTHQRIFFEKLNSFIDRQELVLAMDIGDCIVWAIEYIRLSYYQPILVSNKLGSMGFCLPALIAAKLERPENFVVGICGDGGFQMVLGELNTASQLNLNIFLIVFNNGVLQRVVAQQETVFGTVLKNPDFNKLGQSCGASCVTISSNEEIDTKLEEAFAIKNGPVMIVVNCDPCVFAPMKKS